MHAQVNGKPQAQHSRLALTDGTADILRPVALPQGLALPDYCDVELAGQRQPYFRLFFYRYTQAGALLSPSAIVEREFCNRFPEAKRLQCDSVGVLMSVAATDTTAAILLEAWPRERLLLKDDETRTALSYLYTRIFSQVNTLHKIADWRANKGSVSCAYEHSPEYPLAEYQQVALTCSVGTEGYGLGMEQGTGKTPIAIARVCNEAARLRASGESRMYRVLVVCPKTVCTNWVSEFQRFATRRGRVDVMRGDKIKRVKMLADAFRVDPADDSEDALDEYTCVVTSWDMLSRAWQALAMIHWDLVVYDEAHYAKDSKTKRYKYACAVRDNATARMLLTGTPIGNSALDLYAQWELMGQGYSGFTSFKAFKQFYAVYDKADPNNQQGVARLLAIQNMPFIKERLARTWFLIRKQEALPDLPAKVYDIVDVEMSDAQASIYSELQSSLMLEIEDELRRDGIPKQLVINNILTRLLRLAEITSGYVRFDEVYNPATGELLRPQLIDRFDPNPKLDILLELLRDKTPEQKTIVWACFTENIRTIRAALELNGIDCVTFYGATSNTKRDEATQRFNCDPACKVFVGNPSAGGIGLNLIGFDRDNPNSIGGNTNCDHVIYYSQGWSALVRSQSEDRAHRPQTRVPVRITDLCVANSVDEEIRCRVLQKLKHSLEVRDVREIIMRVLQSKLVRG